MDVASLSTLSADVILLLCCLSRMYITGSQRVCLNPTTVNSQVSWKSTNSLSYLEMGINPASLTQTGFIGLTGIMVAAAACCLFQNVRYYSC